MHCTVFVLRRNGVRLSKGKARRLEGWLSIGPRPSPASPEKMAYLWADETQQRLLSSMWWPALVEISQGWLLLSGSDRQASPTDDNCQQWAVKPRAISIEMPPVG
jgi:hypothetical protein